MPAFSACSTVYPEIATPVHPGAGQASISPAPPPDLFFVNFEGARIPERTRDGRQWDRLGGSAPDPFAIFFLNDGELFRTPVQSNTLEPTWPDQKHANYRIPETAKVRIEVWDSNPINNHPICVKELRRVASEAIEGRIEIECSSGAHVNMIFEAARPLLGLGFYYELRTQAIYVTRTLAESPAARAGLKRGDQIVKIQGKDVEGMEDGEPQSLINANARMGVVLHIKHADGSEIDVKLKDGPLYPAGDEDVKLD